MLGSKEWLFVIIQLPILLLVSVSTYTILDRISDYLAEKREQKLKAKTLAKFYKDVELYKKRKQENGENY